MRRFVRLAVIGALAFAGAAGAGAAGAAAQPAQPAPTVPVEQQVRPPMEQRARAPRGGPTFTVFGLPVWLAAPVGRPYCNCVAQNYGGQPQRSRDSVMRAASGMNH